MGKKKILLVDDEPAFVDMLKLRLESNNYDVVVAYDGQEGLKKIELENPDLVILDVLMPKLNGYDCCNIIKNNPEFKDIPVIFLTVKAGDEDNALVRKVGADNFIVKPFDPHKLLSRIKDLIKE
ncbi:MAG: response regulator [Candidatus Omnitrophica bacterium]|nr:response regulator [Candidatus Omnitrophota bacterium]